MRQAAARPDAVAAVQDEWQLSYAQLDRWTTRRSDALRARGIGSGSLVAIFQDRSLDALAALLSILKTGAAYLPLDPSHPAARLTTILADARPDLVITTNAHRAALPAMACSVLSFQEESPLDSCAPGQESEPSRDLMRAAITHVDQLCYVIYTSGSTGQPKGVQIPHGAVASLLAAINEELKVDAADVVLSLTTLSFDIAALEVFLPLTVGARVVLAPSSAATDARRLSALLLDHRMTMAQATPSGWRILLDEGSGRMAPACASCVAAKRCRRTWQRGSSRLGQPSGTRMVRPRRRSGRRCVACGGKPMPGASVGRSAASKSTYWTRHCGRWRWAALASCTSVAPGSHAATGGSPGRPRRCSCLIRSAPERAPVCIGPVTGHGGRPTAASSSWAGRMGK
jgi:acyl-CoA synthetase (AMP-forming)/AMP-acid ligase II